MNFNEKKYSLNTVDTFNKKITNIILKSQNFKDFLKFDYCNNEYLVLLDNIKKSFNKNEIKLFSQSISNNKETSSNIIAKYYIKLFHLFSSIFNITSNNNLKIINQKLHIHFNYYLIPEIDYIYKSKYDFFINDFVLNDDDKSIYKKKIN